MSSLSRKGVSPVIAIVLLLMMTVAAAGAAYFWLTSMQSSMQESSRKSIGNIMEASGRRVTAQATLCKPTYPYKGLVGYWMMDEGSGSYANDSSGNENTGTVYGANWTDGEVENALEFDESESDYVEVPHSSSINVEDHLTISLWVKWTTYNRNNYTAVIGKGDSAAGYHLNSPGDTIRFTAGGVWDLIEVGWQWGTGNWVHIAVTFDRPDAVMYVNGEQVGTGTADSSLSYTEVLAIGRRPHHHDKYFEGRVDELRIYDRALSENEIQQLYEAENHSARRRIDVTVRNIGSEKIPEATWVANLKHDGTTVETDAYNASSIDTGELATLKFYFTNFKPNTEYTIELQGTGTSTTVSC